MLRFFFVVNLRSLEMRSLLVVNEQFSGRRNAAGGHYGQILSKQLKPFPGAII